MFICCFLKGIHNCLVFKEEKLQETWRVKCSIVLGFVWKLGLCLSKKLDEQRRWIFKPMNGGESRSECCCSAFSIEKPEEDQDNYRLKTSHESSGFHNTKEKPRCFKSKIKIHNQSTPEQNKTEERDPIQFNWWYA